MKKLIVFASICILLTGCTSKCIEDSGIAVFKETVVKNFDKIEVSGPVKLVLKQDSSYRVKIAADSNIMKYIGADVSSGTLKIKLDGKKYCGSDSVVVTAGIGELKQLNTEGTVKVQSDGIIYAKNIELELDGAADISLNLNVAKLTTETDGIAALNLTGQAGIHELNIKGTAKVNAFDFIAGVYNIDINGTAKGNINVLNDLKIKTSGSSEFYYKGNPKHVDEKKSGAAKLEKVN